VIVEMRNGEVRNATLPSITAGKKLAELQGTDCDALVLGKGAKSGAEKVKTFGLKKVFYSEAPAVADYTAEAYAEVAKGMVQEKGYQTALATATTMGKDLMPRLAALVDAGMVSDCTGVEKKDGGIAYVRPMYAGNADARVVIETPTHVLTVRETAFDAATPDGPPAEVAEVPVNIDPAALKARFVEYRLTKSARPELTEAKIIASAGRGVKDANGVKLIEQPSAGADPSSTRGSCPTICRWARPGR
jgi:electron transfer flavoprotein alpha subunit